MQQVWRNFNGKNNISGAAEEVEGGQVVICLEIVRAFEFNYEW